MTAIEILILAVVVLSAGAAILSRIKAKWAQDALKYVVLAVEILKADEVKGLVKQLSKGKAAKVIHNAAKKAEKDA